MLVPTGPTIVEATRGHWRFIHKFLKELLNDEHQSQQLPAVFALLAQARKNLLHRRRRPLPAAVFVGPKNCGKTLLIEITRLALGGRAAAALGALNGTTAFNGDTAGAELLHVDDEIASKDHRARVALAQGIKRQLFGQAVRIESKGRNAIMLRPIQMLIIAVNNEAQHLRVLPELDDSLLDKVSLFQCKPTQLAQVDDREKIARLIRAELPAFLHHLESFKIPKSLKNPRTGVAAWRHPNVVEMLAMLAPEERLRELLLQLPEITSQLDRGISWEGSSAEIEHLLNLNETTRYPARILLTWNAATGTYISQLIASGRISASSRISSGVTIWKITSLSPH
jgi:hypothetical protein